MFLFCKHIRQKMAQMWAFWTQMRAQKTNQNNNNIINAVTYNDLHNVLSL
jgi:hypothetical protein